MKPLTRRHFLAATAAATATAALPGRALGRKPKQEIIDLQTEPGGVKVRAVEVKQIDLPSEMQRAMAKQAEAERETSLWL